jgi:hypothetical protein
MLSKPKKSPSQSLSLFMHKEGGARQQLFVRDDVRVCKGDRLLL